MNVPADCRHWLYYPIEMPVNKDGQGPATIGVDAVKMTYEVWDIGLLSTHGSFDNLPDAINLAMKLTVKLSAAGVLKDA